MPVEVTFEEVSEEISLPRLGIALSFHLDDFGAHVRELTDAGRP
jgi:hypothetical protein